MKFCVKCGKQLSQDSNFCPGCGTPALIQAEPEPSEFSSETKTLGPKECLHEKAVQQEVVDRIFCTGCNSFVNKGTWEAEPYEGHKFERCDHLRIAPGIRGPHKEPMCSECGVLLKREVSFKEDKRPIMEATGKPKWPLWIGIALLIVIIVAIASSSSQSDSYKIGYQAGKDLSASNTFFYMDGQPSDICNTTLTMSKQGNPNDNIDWQSVDAGDFNQGCLDAYADTHDGNRTKTVPAPTNSDSPSVSSEDNSDPNATVDPSPSSTN